MLLCKCDKSCRSQLAMCTISVHSYCNKRGQTSRLVAKAQIQTSYNFEKNLFKCDSYLDYVCVRHIILLLESFFHFMVGTYWQRPVSIHLSFFVHKNILHSAPQSNSYSAPRFSLAKQPSNSTKYSSIQKSGDKCSVGASDNDILLPAVWNSGNFETSNRVIM